MSTTEITIAPATANDVDAIKALLTNAGLPTSGVDEHWKTFLVARHLGELVACGGAEAYQFAALIRSIAVTPAYRSQGLGRRVVRQLLDRLASRGLREFYLLTTSAEEYFRKRGFKPIDRDEVHPQLLGSTEFQDGVCDSAVCMRLVMLA
ncbi:MAG: GNAT family N-acetyltransferase [Acidobacteria bacterium]|nr:GNAT family N-acetyltransferase [Acidobacteriota bacterium]MBV9478678.1 GNAT family N-acetyltransferase [Acidobacteriota bacterium]